ncbi:Glutathione S-transferase U18 [Ananas comosus]|uniref:glutathione transferase n=1 Tax=Ananas comosus TaxID=4615 RepID=A0A199VCG9_ANACO|nr:Glutathione S-transferase U18 [Ananas comosus]
MEGGKGEEEEVKVVGGWASPFVMRVRLALKLKGVRHEFLQEELGRKSELLLRSNPVRQQIPVLVHNARPVCESAIIVQYIDDVWPSPSSSSDAPSILPSHPYDRATARFWAAYIDDKLPRSLRILRGTMKGDTAEALGQVAAALLQLEAAFENCSKGKRFFGGDNVGYLDIILGSFIGWIQASEKILNIKLLDEAKVPLLVAWADRFCAHDAVKEVMPEVDKLIEFGKLLQALLNANHAR